LRWNSDNEVEGYQTTESMSFTERGGKKLIVTAANESIKK